MFRVKERDERQRGLEAKTAEAQRYVDLLEGEYDVLLEKCVEYVKREKDQHELEACHVDLEAAKKELATCKAAQLGWRPAPGGLLTLRDAATGEILFMEDVFTGARAGFMYGERDGKQGYRAVETETFLEASHFSSPPCCKMKASAWTRSPVTTCCTSSGKAARRFAFRCSRSSAML